jgi:S1-C subfamily serine protease
MGGVEILGVDPQSAAEISGLRKGNVITEVNGRKVSSTQDLAAVLAQNAPGSKIAVVYLFKSNLGWMPEETIVVLTK